MTITDYHILFIDDYSDVKDLQKSLLFERWERAYSKGILDTLEQRAGRDDLVFLDLETGNNMKDDPRDISAKVSKEKFYLSVKHARDERKAWSRIKEWNAGGYIVMPVTHDQIVDILRGINP